MSFSCPNCEIDLEPTEFDDYVRVSCEECQYSQAFTECPECGELSFAIHPHSGVGDGLKGQCVDCDHHKSGGVHVAGF